jgi:hypothetical protein
MKIMSVDYQVNPRQVENRWNVQCNVYQIKSWKFILAILLLFQAKLSQIVKKRAVWEKDGQKYKWH